MNTYTGYKLCLNNKLTCKEHLNNLNEVEEWISNKYGKFASLLVKCDQTNKAYILTDNGSEYVKRLIILEQ